MRCFLSLVFLFSGTLAQALERLFDFEGVWGNTI